MQPRKKSSSLLGSQSLPVLSPATRQQANLAAQQLGLLLFPEPQKAPPRLRDTPPAKAIILPPIPEPQPQLPAPEVEPAPAPEPLARAFIRPPRERMVLRLPNANQPLRFERERDSVAEAIEAQQYELYRCCFWPLHVWKRTVRNSSKARRQVSVEAPRMRARPPCLPVASPHCRAAASRSQSRRWPAMLCKTTTRRHALKTATRRHALTRA